MYSFKAFYRGTHGTSRMNFNHPKISKDAVVVITAAEWQRNEENSFHLDTVRPHLGAAAIWVSNVGVHGPEGGTGGVEFLLHVDWGQPLDVVVTFTVLDPVQEYVPTW